MSARTYRYGFVDVDVDVDVNDALAGRMYRVCAELAGCYENPVSWSVRLGWFVS